MRLNIKSDHLWIAPCESIEEDLWDLAEFRVTNGVDRCGIRNIGQHLEITDAATLDILALAEGPSNLNMNIKKHAVRNAKEKRTFADGLVRWTEGWHGGVREGRRKRHRCHHSRDKESSKTP